MQRNIHDPIEDNQEDCLGRLAFAHTILRQLVRDSCPNAVGLFGDWGTGKSSLLKLLISLNKDPDYNEGGKLSLVIFDAWLYESTGNLFIPIYVWLIKHLKAKGEISVHWTSVMKRVLLATSLAAANLLLRRVALTSVTSDELSEIKGDFVDHLKDTEGLFTPKRWEGLVDDIENAREDFQKAIQLALEGEKYRRFVFCIDNLDRCSPDSAVHLLESIKNYFSVEGVVWLIAVDPHVISAYIEKEYGTEAVGGYNYLDKIFPEQYHIPPLSIQSDSTHLDSLLDRALGDLSVTAHPSDWKRYAQIPRILVPRRLIKGARKFAEAHRLPSHRGTPASADVIFALILLYYGWPEFYERFSSDRPEHVEGMLANFYEDLLVTTDEKPPHPLPLPSRFVDDRDLRYFLIQAFFNEGSLEATSEKLASAMYWLQLVGLP